MPGEEFPTTNEDLAGFWDMVMLQVVQVNELFDQIEKLRNSQWQEVCSVSVHPQTINSLKPPGKNFYSHNNTDNVTPPESSSRISYSHSVSNKRVRFDDATFTDPEESNQVKKDFYISQVPDYVALEMRLCDDAFQVLTLSQNLEEYENHCDDYEVDYNESNTVLFKDITEIQTIKNDSSPLKPCTSYVINYVNRLQHDISPFYFENCKQSSSDLYLRDDFIEKNISPKFQTIFRKDDDELKQQKHDHSLSKGQNNYSELFTKDTQKDIKRNENNATNLKTISSSSKRIVSADKRMGKVRPKAKSYSSTGRNLNQEIQIKNGRRTRSHTPENRPRKNDSIKSGIGDEQKSCNLKPVIIHKRGEEKVPTPSKIDKFPYKSFAAHKGSVKKLRHNVTFSNDIKELPPTRKDISSVDCNAVNMTKSSTKNLLHAKPKKMLKMKNAKKLSHNYYERCNLSVVSEVWSNLDFVYNNKKSQRKSDSYEENCTFAGTWNVRKQAKELKKEQVEKLRKDQIKESPQKIEKEAEISSVISDNIFWRLSDSKPFIPLSPETLRQLRQIYNVENYLSSTVNKSEKLERMKVYDKKRKQTFKIVEDESLKKMVSRGITSDLLDSRSENNFLKRLDTQDTNSVSLQDNFETASETLNPIPESHDFSMQCINSLANLVPRVANNKNKSTLVINNITNNIPTWPIKDGEIRNFLSTLISSISSEIVSKVTKHSSSKLKNRVSIKKLSYGVITKNIKSKSNANVNVIMDISQHVRSNFVSSRLPNRKSGKSIISTDLDNYLPLKKGFHVNSYLEDTKYMQLFPNNIKFHTNSSNTKSFPIKVKHVCTFLKSNRTLCRLSLYLYIYGILSLVFIFLKITAYDESSYSCILNPRILYNLY